MRTRLDLQLMASGEILGYIPPETYQAIVRKDEHPLFRAYCIGEEGEATSRIVGGGSKVLNWLRSAISAMVTRLQFGTKVFHGHGETNDHSGRTAIGELVGKALEYVEGKLRAVAVTYIYPQFRDLPADAASIEAEVDMDPSGRSNVIEGVHLNKVTGIAVGDSRKVKTAFKAAGLVAQLQAFETQGNEDRTGGQRMDLTIDQVRDFIMVRRLTPSELFSEEHITKDRVFRDKLAAENAMRDQLQKKYDSLETESKAKIEKLEKDNVGLRTTLSTGKAQQLAKGIVESRKLDPQKAKFIEMKLPAFKVEGESLEDAAITGQLNKFVDGVIDEYDKFAAVFRPGEQQGKGQGAGGAQQGQGQGGQGQGAGSGNGLLARNV